ncbi:hypothetical protein ACLB2K_006426 [Fragaria x ananassa]
MATLMQKIKDIEDEMARTQKNKATAHHLGLLKAKLAKLRRDLLEPTTKGGGGAGEGFDVTKSGDARVGLVGFPSVGKSTLLNKLTGTFSEVASYEFTTLTCIPGVIVYRGAKIQLLDLPGIIEGAKDGKGRGRQVISTARTCNCIIIVLDAIKPITHKRLIEKELEGFGIRLNKEPPNLTFRKKEKGGINFTSTVTNTHLDLETVKAICSEYRIHNADITLRFDATADDLIDVIEGSRVYMPCIYAVNKIDQITLEELEILDKLPHYCPVSAHLEWNLDGLLEKIWEYLNLTRIYTKPKGMNPDYEDPVILSSKTRTVEDFLLWFGGLARNTSPKELERSICLKMRMLFRSSKRCDAAGTQKLCNLRIMISIMGLQLLRLIACTFQSIQHSFWIGAIPASTKNLSLPPTLCWGYRNLQVKDYMPLPRCYAFASLPHFSRGWTMMVSDRCKSADIFKDTRARESKLVVCDDLQLVSSNVSRSIDRTASK